MKYQILHGDNRETLKSIPDNSIDAIVTDPPYGIDFLGKAWDANTGALETYQECLRVLKPGGHILAFSAARTYHHLAITLEQAGFEIRDQIMWIYSSGFPKSQDVGRSIQRSLGVKEHYTIDEWEEKQGYTVNRPGDTMGFGNPDKLDGQKDSGLSGKIVKVTDPEAKKWEGWGTALKPAHEPIALARKPMKLSIAKNCQDHGVGALNIDATRVPYADKADKEFIVNTSKTFEQTGTKWTTTFDAKDKTPDSYSVNDQGRFPSNVLGDIPDYQKYFYCPKVSRSERHVGFDTKDIPVYDRREEGLESAGIQGLQKLNGEKRTEGGNNHPTVKPIELMKYLIKLITPPGGTVLDPFNGSGSTGCAAVELGMEYIGCELDADYVEIARRRIEAWYAATNPTTFNQIFQQE
jgi:site-specific DNA-methyltransferase (adenine-specific)